MKKKGIPEIITSEFLAEYAKKQKVWVLFLNQLDKTVCFTGWGWNFQ
jgi:hypothetical protein